MVMVFIRLFRAGGNLVIKFFLVFIVNGYLISLQRRLSFSNENAQYIRCTHGAGSESKKFLAHFRVRFANTFNLYMKLFMARKGVAETRASH